MCFAVMVAEQVRIVSSVLIIMTGFERDFNAFMTDFLFRTLYIIYKKCQEIL